MDKLSLLLAQLLTLSVVVASAGSGGHPDRVSDNLRPTQLHFYWHDRNLGDNATGVTVAQSPTSNISKTLFGMVNVFDDPLTILPNETSDLIGRAQGMYFSADRNVSALQMVMTLVFNGPKYFGSTLIVMGRNPPDDLVRVLAIVGGTGIFHSVTGYAQISTVLDASSIGYYIVEYNCTLTYPENSYSS
ncbi:hypothetical protein KSP40_PGU005799 [Platanthera guangdongensis]|uniref:Dirigent protein n=1 Tax=Platanthera guangdongensis TaxID=2320717 RepID=A0ABR2MFL9_9ASPA